MEARSGDLSARSVENLFRLHFSVVWMGSRSTVVLCTALSLTPAFHVICDITVGKKSIPKARYGKTNPADNWWGVGGIGSSRTMLNETWAAGRFELHACTTRHSPPDCIASPCLLIVRRPKNGTAKTVPAVPAARALHTLQTAHLPILPLTAILYVAAKEQPDVTSSQLNSLALVCNWSIGKGNEILYNCITSLLFFHNVI